jgi:hypothetical protein
MENSVISNPLDFPLRWSHLVRALLLLNLADCCFTIAWVCGGYATEANEAMALMLQMGPVPFAVAKNALVLGGAYVLFLRRRRFFAQVGLVTVTFAYLAVCAHHLRFLLTSWV